MALQALLDTNICIYIARNRPPAMAERFATAAPGSLGISIVTWGALCFGANKSHDPIRARSALDRFVEVVPVQAMNADVGRHYGEIRAILERAGTPIGNNDLWIAAHARSLATKLTACSTRARPSSRTPNTETKGRTPTATASPGASASSAILTSKGGDLTRPRKLRRDSREVSAYNRGAQYASRWTLGLFAQHDDPRSALPGLAEIPGKSPGFVILRRHVICGQKMPPRIHPQLVRPRHFSS